MGIHYVNAKPIGADPIDIKPGHERSCMSDAQRQAGPDCGRIYHVEGAASLEGQLFNFNGTPNRYSRARSTNCMCGRGR